MRDSKKPTAPGCHGTDGNQHLPPAAESNALLTILAAAAPTATQRCSAYRLRIDLFTILAAATPLQLERLKEEIELDPEVHHPGCRDITATTLVAVLPRATEMFTILAAATPLQQPPS